LKALGLEADYRATHVTPDALGDYIAARRDDPLWRGCNVTIPHKLAVMEHVADPGEFLRTCSRLLKPGGLMIVATLNRTLKALALAKIGAEYGALSGAGDGSDLNSRALSSAAGVGAGAIGGALARGNSASSNALRRDGIATHSVPSAWWTVSVPR
jgi:SAM-dependent methyltransferase